MTNPWKESFEELREQTLSFDAIKNYADKNKGMVYDPKTQKFVPATPGIARGSGPTPTSSTVPADGKPYKDGPLWDGPETKPSTTPTTAPADGKPYKDGPLWDGPETKPSTTPTTQPKPQTSRPTSSPTASTAEKIKGGLDVYKSQVASGNVKGAEETGKATWALANPELAKREAERQRTRGTSATTNPLMQDMKSRMPAPTTSSPQTASTAFDKSTPALATPKPTGAADLSKTPVTNKASTTFGQPTLLSRMSSPESKKQQLGSARARVMGAESFNVVKGFLVREGYVNEERAKRWWDDDGDGKGYEKGEVEGKFKRKKKK